MTGVPSLRQLRLGVNNVATIRLWFSTHMDTADTDVRDAISHLKEAELSLTKALSKEKTT